jgi:1,4-dihydroxy-2-naphthoate octaprenyltransferase
MAKGSAGSKAKKVLKLGRLNFLLAGFLLYTTGAIFAFAIGFALTWDKFLFGYLIFFLAHLSLHYSNDYFDRKSDAESKPTAFSGGSGILVSDPELAPLAIRLAVALLIGSWVVAVAFTFYFDYGLAFLAFSILASLLAWFYTAPPLKFAYRGLGEVSTMFALGLVMPGMGYYVISGTIDAWFLVLSIPLYCYGLFFILTVETPDMEVDATTGKRGYVVRFGRRRSAYTSLAACIFASLTFLVIYLTGAFGEDINVGLIALAALVPLGVAALGVAKFTEDREKLVAQVRTNITSLIVFFILVDLVLIYA